MASYVQSELESALRRFVAPMVEAALAEAIAPILAELDALKRTPSRHAWKDRAEAAAYLACSKGKLDELAASGRLRKHKLDGKPLFHVNNLDALVIPVAVGDEG